MRRKIIIGASALLLLACFVCGFVLLSNKNKRNVPEDMPDIFIEETITTVPIDDILEDDSLPRHSFSSGTP